ncbi:invasion associated locus B family protein [Indioceanicola profundi]|uniref:invasion associated locus B family protein n=1 Tax=Indioceanicola profundi TaxID=2220096 RepID=UPI000E6ADCB3|nr:invasion associated locus B family protein [Indioceanicola profundi]
MRSTNRHSPAPSPSARRPVRVLAALALTAGLALAASAGPASAQSSEPKLIGTFRDWNAFVLDEPGGRVCWMASKPTKDEGNYSRRGDIFALVTHRPYEKSLDVVSFVAGYPHADGSEVTVQIGNSRFELFTEGDTSWARDDKTDREIVQAIRAGSSMVVRGTSSRGTRTTDTYSLAGSSAAYDAINKACDVSGR